MVPSVEIKLFNGTIFIFLNFKHGTVTIEVKSIAFYIQIGEWIVVNIDWL